VEAFVPRLVHLSTKKSPESSFSPSFRRRPDAYHAILSRKCDIQEGESTLSKRMQMSQKIAQKRDQKEIILDSPCRWPENTAW
jgi:hypothetical protein